MRKKVSINIFLALVLIFSLFPVYPPRIAAAPIVISPIDGRNHFDGTILDYGYIAGDTINNYSESAFKFNGIDSSRSIDSVFLTFDGDGSEWDNNITNLKIAVAVDNWPQTTTQMPALVIPEKSINSVKPNIFSSTPVWNPATSLFSYRVNLSSVVTSSNVGADGIISLLISTTSQYDAYIFNPKLEINYAAAPVNTAPVLSGIGIKSVNEKNLLTFTATASDAEGDTLTYSLGNAPTGASINSTTGVFTWTPTEAQGPDSFTIKVIVSDGALTDEEDIIVTVNEINEAPVLGAIGNKTVNEETLLTFTATATDADLPANTLTFSLVGAPSGASINPITGVFTWTPTEAQGPGSYAFTVRVSDGTQIDSEQITITVNEINAAPILGAIGNKTVNEGSQLTFTATATDSDSAILTYSLVGAPTGASINATTGVFSWIPSEAQGPGTYSFIVRVSDGTLTDDETITVTVNEVNVAPVLATISDKTVNEGSELTFTASATDTDLPANTLTYSLVGAPTGASINTTTGVFTWTPTEAQGPGSYTFSVRVSDGALTDEEQITVTVNEVNVAPVLAAIGNKTVNEETLLTFTAVGTDTDLPANTLTYSLVNAPTGASINPTTGVFTWSPTEAQGPGSYPFTVRVSDGLLTDEEQITVTVNEVNAAPVLSAIGDKTIDEGSQLTFTASATDSDSAILTYSLVGAPTGASINATTGVFTWTPTEAQGPSSYTFTVHVSDGVLTDEEEITVTVNEVNVAPVLATISDKAVDEGSELTFTVSASDADLPANTLTYSLVDAPTGASINATTGVFTWTPMEAQGPGSFTFKVVVSDGALTDEEEITFTVNEVNTAPVLAAIGDKTVDEETLLTFTATATDVDMPANTLTYSLVDAPTGANINAITGVFTWTPTEAQGPGNYTFTISVTDGALTDEEEITVTVNEVNAAPVLAAIGDKTIDEGSQLTFTATATDPDSAILTYSLIDTPTGASINSATGVFTWTPSEAQGPSSYTFTVHVSDGVLTDEEEITVTVNEVNVAPVLEAIGDKAVDEGSESTFTVSATDADLPANTLTYSLVDAPTGASINATTGVFTWTPTEAQGPGSFTLKVVVSDGALSDEEEITVTVNEVNTAPVLAAIGDKTVDEETLLTFTAVGTDTDLPANMLTYSLVDAPTGASINAMTGEFIWTPTEAQGPGSYTFEVLVNDGVLSDSEEITVTVNEVNVAPILQSIGNKSVNQGRLLRFTATATDKDDPANTLTYSLVDAPVGAVIDSQTGEFTWQTLATQVSKKYTFTVKVSDGLLTDEETITVTVKSAYTDVDISDLSGNAVHVLVNGKVVDAGTATISEINGQKVVTVAVDEQKLMQRFEDEGKQAVITIPVTTDSNVVIGQINGSIIKKLEKQQAIIVLQTNNASYTIPAEQIDITAISSQLGANVELEDVKLKIEIAEPLKNMLQIVEAAVNREGLTQVAPTLNFKVSVEYEGRTVEILQFNAYVKRTIAIPEGTNPNQITTGIVVEPDGSVRHVPTQITKVGDRYYAVIHSLTNGTYAVVRNPLQFIDVENHWAKAAVNNMGSRIVVNGIGNGMYYPDQDITRAEFAAIIVRGLGLSLSQKNSLFTDVGTTAWYRSAVQTAYEYGLINGFEDGTFRPNEKITREQAMLIMSKAMIITGLKESATRQSNVEVLREFTDASTVSEWALDGVADSVSSGIISGRNNNLLAPKANITRAEVAMIIQRLLQTSDLINR